MNIAAVEIIVKLTDRKTGVELFSGSKLGAYKMLLSLKSRKSPRLKNLVYSKYVDGVKVA